MRPNDDGFFCAALAHTALWGKFNQRPSKRARLLMCEMALECGAAQSKYGDGMEKMQR